MRLSYAKEDVGAEADASVCCIGGYGQQRPRFHLLISQQPYFLAASLVRVGSSVRPKYLNVAGSLRGRISGGCERVECMKM